MKKKKDQINYYSKRKGISTDPQTFHGNYWPVETNFTPAEQGTLTHWLAERYRLWTTRGATLYQGDIHHRKWNLGADRKSTRLNSSHVAISYAVFCLKKKKTNKKRMNKRINKRKKKIQKT